MVSPAADIPGTATKFRARSLTVRSNLVTFATVSFALVVATGCIKKPKGDTAAQKRVHIMQVKKEALAELYREEPDAKAHIARAPGYAVFSNKASKILMLATGSGFGVAVDNATGKHTYMRMLEAGGGVGIGIKHYRAVYVFNDKDAFEEFVTVGIQIGGDADVALQKGDQGASADAALNTDQMTGPVTVYQFTEAGIALSAVATGTKYWVDDELN
jgi:lipid-binding SYLF domain-containing protein